MKAYMTCLLYTSCGCAYSCTASVPARPVRVPIIISPRGSGEMCIRDSDYAEAEAMGCRLTAPYLDASVTRLYKRGGDGFSSAALLKDSDISAKYGEYLSDKRRDAVYLSLIHI